uniref:Uncharacterized protein n=1 Tax=Anguilla anguilla TaxID=7936 RepID=A0A0E9PXY1_ANGAN
MEAEAPSGAYKLCNGHKPQPES